MQVELIEIFNLHSIGNTLKNVRFLYPSIYYLHTFHSKSLVLFYDFIEKMDHQSQINLEEIKLNN